jgi:hypothetical protein
MITTKYWTQMSNILNQKKKNVLNAVLSSTVTHSFCARYTLLSNDLHRPRRFSYSSAYLFFYKKNSAANGGLSYMMAGKEKENVNGEKKMFLMLKSRCCSQ